MMGFGYLRIILRYIRLRSILVIIALFQGYFGELR